MILSQTTAENQKHFITNRDNRVDANGFMPTYDKLSGDVIGKVINISSNGICILIDEYHHIDDELQLVIDAVDSNGNSKEIELNGKLRWIEKNGDNDMFLAGFKIEFNNLKSKMRFNRLLQKYD